MVLQLKVFHSGGKFRFKQIAAAVALVHLMQVVCAQAAERLGERAERMSQQLILGMGKAEVIDLPRNVKDVLVANPRIANAVVRSAKRIYILGVAIGQTRITLFDDADQQIASYDIAVTRDLNGIRALLRQSWPHVRVEGLGDGVVLSGIAESPADAQRAAELAARLTGGIDKVVNSIVVRSRDQVTLKLTVAEVQRDVIKQLGIDLSGTANFGSSVLNFSQTNPMSATGAPLVSTNEITSSIKGISATLRAMERVGVVRTLAEPNLTAISGETAAFIVGGEFPIPKGYTCDPATRQCSTSIDYKKFGITLNFVPIVMSEGRISLRVVTEVSEISSDNSLQLVQTVSDTQVNTLTIPSIKTRRVETTVEIPSGGSLALAGLIQEQTKQAINGLPGLMQLPLLGNLFKSRDYVNRQTELMVMITPYLVRAVAQKDLSRPGDGFIDTSDQSSMTLGTINRIYGAGPAPQPNGQNRIPFGFITE